MKSYRSQRNPSSQTQPLSTLNNFTNKTLLERSNSKKPSKSTSSQLSWLVSKYCTSTVTGNGPEAKSASHQNENLPHIANVKPSESSVQLGTRDKLKPEESYTEQEEEFAKVHKKVKKQSISSTNSPNHLNCSLDLEDHRQEGNQEDNSGCTKETSIASTRESVNSQEKDNELNREIELKAKKNVKLWKNINVFYDESTVQLCFKVEFVLDGESETRVMVLMRQEMIEYNPQILLYFYENHLHFPSIPEFNPEMLKKV
jgi:hypothetical protein